jgi:hypothetical protein
MSAFGVINAIRGIKPGATVLARAISDQGTPVPALVEQRFGRGRAAALLVGDLWKWEMHRQAVAQSDFAKAWRQTVRWLVSDVPKRIETAVTPASGSEASTGAVCVVVQVRDPVYAPLDNATVTVKVRTPKVKPSDEETVATLRAEASLSKPGQYETTFIPRVPGMYRAEILVKGPDGVDIGQSEAGWTSDPAAEEFRLLQPDKALLQRIAAETGGQVIQPDELDGFASSLPTRQAQVMEPHVEPFWHQSWVFLFAIVCLGLEWGLRRWRGLA